MNLISREKLMVYGSFMLFSNCVEHWGKAGILSDLVKLERTLSFCEAYEELWILNVCWVLPRPNGILMEFNILLAFFWIDSEFTKFTEFTEFYLRKQKK